jgi:hypothetical protein
MQYLNAVGHFLFIRTSLGTALISLLLTWLVGNWITAYWTRRQKRKELDLAAATELYELYGEFIGIWKLWNTLSQIIGQPDREKAYADLLGRSTTMEGRFESLLLRLTSQFSWTQNDLDKLGILRQAFQFPREQMRKNAPIPWGSSEHRQYLAFKSTCSSVGARLVKRRWGRWPAQRTDEPFIYVTRNEPHEDNFEKLGNSSA